LPFDILDLLTVIGLSSVISVLVSGLLDWFSENRKFKREQNIAYLKEKIDSFYSPMIFHFENMKSWGAAWGQDGYAYAGKTLGEKIGDMNSLMRSGLRLVNSQVEQLWYEWQPFGIAASETLSGKRSYPWFSNEELQTRSRRLHEALVRDREKLIQEYKRISKNVDF
jgi:hypothetical protein